MDTNTPQTPPAPDHGPDDSALVRVLRALAAPLRARPEAEVRRRHIAAASAAATGTPAAARAARSPRRRLTALRPSLAGGLALSLVASLVAAAVVVAPDGLFDRGSEEFELAMAPGFTPSPIPLERSEDHVILTVDADRAEAVSEELARLLDADPTVLSVRTDRTAFTVPASVAAELEALEVADVETVVDTPVRSTATPITQSPVPSWGLDRIDAEDEPLDGRYRFVSTGAGVRVYVIDTGVRSDHADLAGRVIPGWSAIEDGRGTEDCNGHGTHVAGTVAGSSFGVAKDARIVAVRVLDCNGAGFASSVVSGISWVIANHPGGPGVINLSLGGPANSAIDRAVADATARGLTVVVAAGNAGGDACAVSPARAESAVTIGATTSRDARASYSNFGPCVDMFAPGSGITSAWHTGAGASATLSGTSMAAPHVAGIAARLLQAEPGAGPSRITELLTGSAQSGVVGDDGGSSNLLVNIVDAAEPSECELLYDGGLEEGQPIPAECLEEICELLEEDGLELPAECLDDTDDDGESDDDGEGEDGDGEGRPEDGPGRDGILPPGFGGTVPGLERAPVLDGRMPPGLVDGVPPGLVRDVPRVNGLSIARVDDALSAEWRVAGAADAYVLECSAAPPGPSWSTDLTVRLSAEAVVRTGDRVSVGLPASVDPMSRCRVAAEVGAVLGVRSNAAPIPAGDADDDELDPDAGADTGRPETPGSGAPAAPGRPELPGAPADAGRPAAPGAPTAPGAPSTSGPPAASPSTPPAGAPPATPGRPATPAPTPSQPSSPAPPAASGPPAQAGPPASVGRPPQVGPPAATGRPELDPSGRGRGRTN
jgi:hypothetical protein